MQWNIPGTTLTVPRADADALDRQFAGYFALGGLTLSQVCSLTGLETHTVQNWVKRGFLPSPVNKRYNMEQVCRLINMNILRGTMPLEQITKLMSYLNGSLADEGDDLVDDTLLFFLFVKLAARARFIGGSENWDEALIHATEAYEEPVPGAREKLINVLKVMLTVWVANQLKAQAEAMIAEL